MEGVFIMHSTRYPSRFGQGVYIMHPDVDKLKFEVLETVASSFKNQTKIVSLWSYMSRLGYTVSHAWEPPVRWGRRIGYVTPPNSSASDRSGISTNSDDES